jgi:hypothetical protein
MQELVNAPQTHRPNPGIGAHGAKDQAAYLDPD